VLTGAENSRDSVTKYSVLALYSVGDDLSSQKTSYRTRRTPSLHINQAITPERSHDKMVSNRSTSSDAHTGAQQSRARSTIPGLTLLGLAFLLLVSCANPASTQGTTPQRTPTTLGNHLSPTPTPQLTQQYDFTEQASGRTITYTVTSRFEIILNQQRYSKKNVQVSCTPPGTLGSVSNLPSVTPPLYVIRYEGVQPGLCTIKNGTFLLTVRIIA
jgi:hypothetical protein